MRYVVYPLGPLSSTNEGSAPKTCSLIPDAFLHNFLFACGGRLRSASWGSRDLILRRFAWSTL